MIQVYSHDGRERIPEEQYYISKDNYMGMNFTIWKEKFAEYDINVQIVDGPNSIRDDEYAIFNLTWPIQPENWEYIRFVSSRPSGDGNVGSQYSGFTYSDASGFHTVMFENGKSEMNFYPPKGCYDIRMVLFISGDSRFPSFMPFTQRCYAEFCYKRPAVQGDYMNYNGDMTLFPTEAYVHAILNGSWEAHLEHSIDPEGRWKYLVEDNVVKMPSFNGEQLFRIKRKEKRDSGISCDMEPIFYDAMGDCWLEDVRPTKKNGQQALSMMLASNGKYSGRSDITKTATAYYQYRNFLEALNGDDENSFINRWGGEILFDNFEVIVNERVGGDYGVELRYGKNIPEDGLTEEIDTGGVVTRIYPKAYNGHTMKFPKFEDLKREKDPEFTDEPEVDFGDEEHDSDAWIPYGYVDSPLIANYPTVKTATITFDDVKMVEDAQEGDAEKGVIICKNQEELNTALENRCREQFDAGLDKPKITIEADMILLQNTELYKDYKVLEEVGFGDTIHCRHSRLDITTDARVIELKYNSIKKCVESVVLGDFQYNFFNDVSSTVSRIDGAIRPDGSVIAEKIAGFINGAMASLRAQYNVAEKQDVLAILFENLDEDSPLYGALAIGTQGIMISKDRTADNRDWDWTTALTANGLVATIIVAGVISDQTGKSWWNLDKGEIHLEGGYFSGTIYAKDGVFSGEVRSARGKIGGWTITDKGFENSGVGIYSEKYVEEDYPDGFTDGSEWEQTGIYRNAIKTKSVHATNVSGYLHDLFAYNGRIPIITNIEETANGGLQWTGSWITVEDGIIKKAPK